MAGYMTTVRIYNDPKDKHTFIRQMVQDFQEYTNAWQTGIKTDFPAPSTFCGQTIVSKITRMWPQNYHPTFCGN